MAKAKKKKKIKMKSPIRAVISIVLLLAVFFVTIKIIQNIASYDPVVKEIEQTEQQNITVLSKDVTAEVVSGSLAADGATVQPETVISYSVDYTYKIGDIQKPTFSITDGLKIDISDTALASVKEPNQIVVSNAPSDSGTNQFTVTVSYGKVEKTFTYTVVFPQ